MIRAIAIDDEPPALRVLEGFCEITEGIQLQKTFTRPHEALAYLEQFPIDLIFLDIQMPSLSGIQLIETIRQGPLVIFTTAHSQYAVDGFNLNAVDFLLKPFSLDRFRQAIEKASGFLLSPSAGKTPDDALYIRADYRLSRIPFGDIVLIEGLDDYVKIHLEGKKNIVARMTLKNMQMQLPTDRFIRVHRSFIVPIQRVESVRNKIIRIRDREIPIGKLFEEEFFLRFFPPKN